MGDDVERFDGAELLVSNFIFRERLSEERFSSIQGKTKEMVTVRIAVVVLLSSAPEDAIVASFCRSSARRLSWRTRMEKVRAKKDNSN